MTDSSSHSSPTPPLPPDDFDDKTQIIGEVEVFTHVPDAPPPEKVVRSADTLLEPDSKIQMNTGENSSVQSVIRGMNVPSQTPHSAVDILSQMSQGSTASAQIETMEESASSDAAVATDTKTDGSDETLISQQPPIKLSGSSFLLKQEGSEGAAPITLPSNFPTDEALPPGTTLGHFRITQYIGGGGMGRVYEAIDLALDRKVAIKLLPHQRAQDQASVARFLNEARSAARLNHEHIAQVYFCGQESGIPFIAFEYVEGINVRDYVIANGPLPLPRAINFLLQTADALAHAAACGVIHRDIKPSNILITPEGKAKLIDMGLARLLKPSDPDDELTASGVTLGTFDYISPEQARDPRDADIRSDIYSLGCTFFFMLTGRPPFPEGTVLQKLLKHQGDTPPDVRDLKPDLPEEVSAVIRKMMAKNPKDRFQHPRLLMDTVIRIAEMIGLTPPAPGETTWRIPDPVRINRLYRHLPWMIVVSLLCLITLTYHYFSKSEPENILPDIPSVPRGIPAGLDTAVPASPLPVTPEPKAVKSQTELEEQDLPPAGRLLDRGENVLLTPRVLTDQILSANKVGRLRQLSTSNSSTLGAEFNLSDVPGTGMPQRLAGGFDVEPISSSDAIGPLRSQGRDPSDLEYLSLLFGDPNRAAMFQWFQAATLRNVPSPTPAHTFPAAAVNSVSLVVDRTGKAPGTYATLQAALSAAYNLGKNGRSTDTPEIQIELRFSGKLEVPLITLVSQRVSLVAAAGCQPVLSYKPTETVSGGTGERMFLLNGSDLQIRGVSIDFAISSEDVVATEWSLFELFGGSNLGVTGSTLTIRNRTSESNFSPLHTNVVFFRKNSPRKLLSGFQTGPVSEKPSSVLVVESIIRGEATVFQCGESGNARFKISCAGINTVGSFLKCEDTAWPQTSEGPIDLQLDRVIGICRYSLLRHVRKEGNKPLFPVSVSLTNSIIKLNDIPLVSSLTSYPLDETSEALSWVIENTTLLNVSGYRRHRQIQTPEAFTDTPLPPQNERKLENLSTDAVDQINSIPPHRFTRDDFYRYIFQPLDRNVNSPAERKVLDEIKLYFFEGK